MADASKPTPTLIDDLLGEADDGIDLFDDELAPARPEARRAASLKFWSVAVILILAGLFLGVFPAATKRARLVTSYRALLEKSAALRTERGELADLERRLDEKDPYLIERLLTDRLFWTRPGWRRWVPPAPAPEPANEAGPLHAQPPR